MVTETPTINTVNTIFKSTRDVDCVYVPPVFGFMNYTIF